MGLYDKLNQNIAAGMNSFDPLFGGLIPRRVIEDVPPRQQRIVSESSLPAMPRPVERVRETGMDKVSKGIMGQQKPMDVVIDWTGEKLALEKKKLDLERDKVGYTREMNEKKYGLDAREQERKELDDRNTLDIDRDKQEIDHRKTALDEWKTKNPEGQIETTKDGKIVIIDKRTGKSIDTGLTADSISEEKKLELQAKNAQELETVRQKNRVALEQTKNANTKLRNINPSQQRTAERDAAQEILNDPNYSWLEKSGYVVKEKDGSITINRPDKASKPQENFTIDAFEKEWKKRSEARINKTFDNGNTNAGDPNAGGNVKTIEMINPRSGEKIQVPENEIEQARKDGAIIEGEQSNAPANNGRLLNTVPPEAVDDSIELYYNDQGKVIGARNRKNPKISKFEE